MCKDYCSTEVSFYCSDITGASCAAGDLLLNSKCYRKFHTSRLSWYDASNDCLSRGGSLAVFTDIGRPSDNRQLTDWLNTTGTDKTFWIGLVRSWWKTTDKGFVFVAFIVFSRAMQRCFSACYCFSHSTKTISVKDSAPITLL